MMSCSKRNQFARVVKQNGF